MTNSVDVLKLEELMSKYNLAVYDCHWIDATELAKEIMKLMKFQTRYEFFALVRSWKPSAK